jgi:chaperone BCS1
MEEKSNLVAIATVVTVVAGAVVVAAGVAEITIKIVSFSWNVLYDTFWSWYRYKTHVNFDTGSETTQAIKQEIENMCLSKSKNVKIIDDKGAQNVSICDGIYNIEHNKEKIQVNIDKNNIIVSSASNISKTFCADMYKKYGYCYKAEFDSDTGSETTQAIKQEIENQFLSKSKYIKITDDKGIQFINLCDKTYDIEYNKDKIRVNINKNIIIVSSGSDVVQKFCEDMYKKYGYCYKAEIDSDSGPGTTHAIKQEVRTQCLSKSKYVKITDAYGNQRINLCDGTYDIEYSEDKIRVNINKNTIIVSSGSDVVQKFCEDMYQKYNSSEKFIISYMNLDTWGAPIHRSRINLDLISKITPSMKRFLDDVERFKLNEDKYIYGNYRRGYLVHGKPSSGKSIIANIIATKYNMPIYRVTLNSNNMSDAILFRLITNVPSNSIIVFDEIEKQYKSAIVSKQNTCLSDAAILEALSGNLDNGNIVILLANNTKIFNGELIEPLIRFGRIDRVIEFKELFSLEDKSLYQDLLDQEENIIY